MTENSTTPPTTIELLDFDVACDFTHCAGVPASWVAFTRRCCTALPPHYLACSGCLLNALLSERWVFCRACRTPFMPVRSLFAHIERLRRAA